MNKSIELVEGFARVSKKTVSGPNTGIKIYLCVGSLVVAIDFVVQEFKGYLWRLGADLLAVEPREALRDLAQILVKVREPVMWTVKVTKGGACDPDLSSSPKECRAGSSALSHLQHRSRRFWGHRCEAYLRRLTTK